MDPEVVELGKGISEDDLLFHDEQSAEPLMAVSRVDDRAEQLRPLQVVGVVERTVGDQPRLGIQHPGVARAALAAGAGIRQDLQLGGGRPRIDAVLRPGPDDAGKLRHLRRIRSGEGSGTGGG